jgi:hypothetical protein
VKRAAGRQAGERRRIVGDRMQDQPGALGRVAPPRRSRFQAQPRGGELAGPVRAASDPRAAGPGDRDRETRMRQEREEGRVRLTDGDLDRRPLAAAHLADHPGGPAERADPRGRPVRGLVRRDSLGQRLHHLVRAERGAVVQLHVLAEPERPRETVPRHGPRGRERGLDVAALAESDQALIDEAHREELRGIARVRRVERRGQTWHADVKLARRCAHGHARDGQQQRREPHEARRRHGALEPTPPTREPATHRRPL